MLPLDFTHAHMKHIATHLVGNTTLEDSFQLSSHESEIQEATKDYLSEYFLKGFKSEDYYAFKDPVELSMNYVYNAVDALFTDPTNFIQSSQGLAKFLFDNSIHPKIKTGEFNTVYFSDIHYGDEVLDAIGLFKSESKVPFIKMNQQENGYMFNHESGYHIDGIDKAAIIFNTDKADGYRLLIIDHTNKFNQAAFWRDDFLRVEAVQNEFHQTKVVMNIAKEFMNDHVKETFDISKAEQIDLLNKSADFFKNNEKYDVAAFSNQVFDDPQMATSYQAYNNKYQSDNNVALEEDLSLSEEAVKKHSRIFKSVLKLDKNFHIYIHGNRDLIQRGREDDGRKFYKIYFDKEV